MSQDTDGVHLPCQQWFGGQDNTTSPLYMEETRMRALIITGICCCIGTNAYAQSAVMGGPLYGGPSEAMAVCYLFNVGFASDDALFFEESIITS